MIYLKNFTDFNDKEILKVLRYAERKIGLKGDTYIEVRKARQIWKFRGVAHSGFLLKEYFEKKFQKVSFNYGWVELWISPFIECDEIAFADVFLDVSLHELGHLNDFRNKNFFKRKRTKTGRRIAHDKRPSEISAENQVYDARRLIKKGKILQEQKVILDFALEVERVRKLK